MKKKLKLISAITVGVPLYVIGWSQALNLANQASDIEVWLGYVMAVGLLAIAAGFAIPNAQKLYRKIQTLGLLVCALAMSGCYTTIPPGHVGIKVEQTGSQRGVQDFPIKTGRVFYNPVNENVLDYPTNVQQYTWTASPNEGKKEEDGKSPNEEMCFKSAESLIFCADVNAAFRVIDEKAPAFYVKFRSDDIDLFIHGFFRNVIRDAFTKFASTYSTDDLNGVKQDELLTKVSEAATAELLTYGVQLIKLGFAHPPRPPQAIQEAINLKLKAVQDAVRVENELRQAKAQAAKQVAEAQGKADSNRIEMQSITPQLLQMRALEKWDGKMPIVQGSAGSTLLDLNSLRAK